MIIKSIFRRYERWNPVHPTYGAFWGIGVGIGCGVGWGPGFGPEVIGYVGAGCGAGFSIGITLLGLGIGLPAKYLLEVPHSAFVVTRRGALDVARARGLLGKRSYAGDRWGDFRSHISDIQQNLCVSFSSFTIENWMDNIIDLPDMKSMLVSNAKHVTDRLQRVSWRFFPWDRGSKN
ncbi:hypothetical protein Pfo_010541 [Paulownia fortunei]|nr:hypothetical protein Pfo_010541 [Paulownia fortunei]